MRTLLTTAAVLAAAVALAPPALAAGPTTVAQLQSDLSACTGTTAAPYTEKLTQDLAGTTADVTVGCAAVLDLNGHALSLQTIVIGGDGSLRITDSTAAQAGHLTVSSASGSDDPAIRTSLGALVIDAGTVTATSNGTGAGIGNGGKGADVGSITINGGNVEATGGSAGAGIGGGDQSTGSGSITINGGTVVAHGNGGAGIGAGNFGGAPPILITGGTVTATGSSFDDDSTLAYDPGIGGGFMTEPVSVTITGGTVTATGSATAGVGIGTGLAGTAAGSAVSISGGTVTATGGEFETGIGGGDSGSGFSTTISGGEVTATGGYSAIGAGEDGNTQLDFGHLTVSGGLLRLPTGLLRVPDTDPSGPEVTVSGTGRIAGSAAANPTYAGITGGIGSTGQIRNDGAIDLPAVRVAVPVADRNFDLSFDAGAGTPAAGTPTGATKVYAGSFSAVDLAFPADPTPPAGMLFTGWAVLSSDGTQHLVAADSDLSTLGDAPGTATTDALAVTAVATYRPSPTVTGTAVVGHLLTAHQSHSTSASVTYRWARTRAGHSAAIPGATSSTYQLVGADAGATISVVTQVAQPARRTTISAGSPTAVIAAGTLHAATPKLTIAADAHPRVGRTLTAKVGGATPAVAGATRHLQWYAGTTPVGGGTARLTITRAMVGKRVHLVVTYTATGYARLALSSASSATVQP